ncbi:E3 ubiquitin-protein ligase SINA-like 2 [Hirschfeldia incana]|nr:E3 ubiquitin-protein ligase SINA-like 2 [Hirschfeldia incana]
MVKETNAKKAVAGEASSSSRSRKRQRLPSVENGREAASVDSEEVIPEARSGTLLELDILDCPVCFQALSGQVFQCDNGHIACFSCCLKLRNKCPACALPIGNNRCRIMERLVEAVTVPCPNAKLGCTEKFSYGKDLAHEKECRFALCYCPAPDCNYSGLYKDLYTHYDANHKDIGMRFQSGTPHRTYLGTEPTVSVLQEYRVVPLVVVQSFEMAEGLSVSVNCIAPCAPGVGKFAFDLTYTVGRNTVTFGRTEMNRILKVSLETPQDDFMSIPSYLVVPIITKHLHICIRRLEEEVEAGDGGEEEEEEEGGEDEEDEEEEEASDYEEEETVEVDVVNNVRRSAREKKANSKYPNKVK